MKKRGLIIIFSLLLLGIITLSVTMIRAWLTDTETTPDVSFTVGDVEFLLQGSFIDDSEVIVPGQDLVDTTFTLSNNSNVDTELRFSIGIKYDNNIDGLDLAIIDIDASKWVLEGGYYYYREAGVVDATSEVGKYIIGKDTTGIEVLSSIVLDGSKVDNSFTGKIFEIVITFEAKQSQYVTWDILGAIDFSADI